MKLTKTFIDEEYGYSIKYPQEWKAKIYRSGVVLSDIVSSDQKSGLQIRIIKSKEEIDSFIDNYSDRFINEMRAKFKNKERVLMNNIYGYKLIFEAVRANKEYFLVSYLLPIEGENKIFVMQAGTPKFSKQKVETVLDAMAESFRY